MYQATYSGLTHERSSDFICNRHFPFRFNTRYPTTALRNISNAPDKNGAPEKWIDALACVKYANRLVITNKPMTL
jgi:hypothetical protein